MDLPTCMYSMPKLQGHHFAIEGASKNQQQQEQQEVCIVQGFPFDKHDILNIFYFLTIF